MSTTLPRRRVYSGDVVNAEDWNALLDDVYRAVTNLNEHNLDAAFVTQVTRADDYALDVAWRLAHAHNGDTAAVNLVIGNQPETVTNALVFQEEELWKTIWEFSWVSTEKATYYAMANVQAQHTINRTWATAGDDLGLGPGGTDQFYQLDNMNIKLAWILDGVNPSEHVRGAMDLGACGLNMERGFGGEYNAQDVSALFPDVPPGDHTMRLCVLRATMPDEVRETLRRVNVPLWEALIWEIKR